MCHLFSGLGFGEGEVEDVCAEDFSNPGAVDCDLMFMWGCEEEDIFAGEVEFARIGRFLYKVPQTVYALPLVGMPADVVFECLSLKFDHSEEE